MLTDFRIQINSTDEMVAARETLRALGYPIYVSLDRARDMEGWNYLVRRDERPQETGHIQRSYGYGVRLHYVSIAEFLKDHFKPTHELEKQELAKLEAEVAPLNTRIQQLKEIIHG